MANFINYILESSIQPVKTNVLWIKNGVPYYYNKKWKPLTTGGYSDYPIDSGEGEGSILIKYSNSFSKGKFSVSLGYNVVTQNPSESAFGRYNLSIASIDPNKATLFSIGNGTKEVLKNVFEIKYSGDLYIEGIDESVQQILKRISSSNKEFERVIESIHNDVVTNSSKITQTDNMIQSIVQKTSKLEDSILEQYSMITQTATMIRMEVAEIESNLNGSIRRNEAAIQINSDQIRSKVEQSTFNSFTGEVSNKFTEVKQTTDSITSTIQSQSGELTKVVQDVAGLTVKTGTLEADIETLKKQSDGAIDTHFGKERPSLTNEPAINWNTEELKNDHLGDLYYNNLTGEAYRFSYDPETSEYKWIELTDSALSDALDKISKLEIAIDKKVTIFYSEPTNYKVGDLWFIHKDYNSYKEGTLVSAIKDGTSFIESDWTPKLKYSTSKELSDLNDEIQGSFKDGILTEVEVNNIKESKKSFELAQKELESAYTVLYISAVATEENKRKLEDSYDALVRSYENLIGVIDNLNASDITKEDIEEYEAYYQDYLTKLQNYSKISSEFTEAIQAELHTANQYIKDIASDNIVTPIEKKQLLEIWRELSEEFTANRGIAVNYKIIAYNESTDSYIKNVETDDSYFDIYNNYYEAYEAIAYYFRFIDSSYPDVFGLSKLTETTTISNGESITNLNNKLNVYYSKLKDFSVLISKITIEITDAHDEVLEVSNKLQEVLDVKDNITSIGKGVVLTTILGIQSEGNIIAGLNASDAEEFIDASKEHGRIVFASGIENNNWSTAKTIIYEDGYVKFDYGLTDNLNIGGANLLRNSGFTGDYLSAQLADEVVLDAIDEMFNPPLIHWSSTNAEVQDEPLSMSGKKAVLNNGSLNQKLVENLVGLNRYTLSFRAKGTVITWTTGEHSETVNLTDDWKHYSFKINPINSFSTFEIIASTCELCDLKLELGNVATSWCRHFLDNSSDRAYYQARKYLDDAFKGETTFSGGLVLTGHIKVGNFSEDGTFIQETAGINGIYNDPNDVAFWAGGTNEQASNAINQLGKNEANFAVSHGGKVVMNDAIIRGTIYANSGSIAGFNITENVIGVEGENSASLQWNVSGTKFLRINDSNTTALLKGRNDGGVLVSLEAYGQGGTALKILGNAKSTALSVAGNIELRARDNADSKESVLIRGLTLEAITINSSSQKIEENYDYIIFRLTQQGGEYNLPSDAVNGKIIIVTNLSNDGLGHNYSIKLLSRNTNFIIPSGYTVMFIYSSGLWHRLRETNV